jgi:hypothetical protein
MIKKEQILSKKNSSAKAATEKKKKKTNINWLEPDLRGEEQFSLLEAMRYVLAFVVKGLS